MIAEMLAKSCTGPLQRTLQPSDIYIRIGFIKEKMHTQIKKDTIIMNEKKQPSVVKTLAWIYSVVGVFTAISIVGPVIMEKVLQRSERNNK